MWVPTLDGTIDRRILVNYRLDPAVAAGLIPAPFRPKVVRGFALAGICLIRMKDLRPRFFPISVFGSSENGALRFAVEWDDGDQIQTGVYIPKRFSTSRFVCLIGGRFFPGIHYRARFQVDEFGGRYRVEMASELNLSVRGTAVDMWPGSAVFDSLDEASAFYHSGAIGYSDTFTPGFYEGLELRIPDWQVWSLAVDHATCDFFDDTKRFPPGTAVFDNALLMRGLRNEFYGRGTLCCPAGVAPTER